MYEIFHFYREHIYNNHNVSGTIYNYMPFVFSSEFLYKADSDMHYKNHPSISKLENRFPLYSWLVSCNIKTEGCDAFRPSLHHSVNFYFTVLSEPSQDSSLGQFLFYRPVRTVTGLIARSVFILPSCQNRHRTHP